MRTVPTNSEADQAPNSGFIITNYVRKTTDSNNDYKSYTKAHFKVGSARDTQLQQGQTETENESEMETQKEREMNRKSTNHFTFSHTREHHHYLGTPFSLSLSLSLSICISVVAHTCVVFYSKVEHVAFPLTNSNTPSTYTFSSFLSLSLPLFLVHQFRQEQI